MAVGTRVRELRGKAGLTQAALAKPRYTVGYISKIESGQRIPSSDAMQHLATRLGVSVHYLATGIPEELEDALRFRLAEAREGLREQALELAEEGANDVLAQCDRYGVERLRSDALLLLGEVAVARGRLQVAVDLLEQAAETAPTERARATILSRLARVYRDLGDLTYARELVESFLERGTQTPLDPTTAAELQTVLISIYYERGDMTRALHAAERALVASEQGVGPQVRAKTLWDSARIHAERKQWTEALDLVAKARAVMEELDEQRSVGKLHVACAFICIEADPPLLEEADRHLEAAEQRLRASLSDLAYVWSERARLAFRSGDFEEAIRHADRALPAFGEMAGEQAKSLYLKGRALAALHRVEDARAVLETAARLFSEAGARQQEAACYREIADLDLQSGDTGSALENLRAGLSALDAAAPRLEPIRQP